VLPGVIVNTGRQLVRQNVAAIDVLFDVYRQPTYTAAEQATIVWTMSSLYD